MAVEQKTGESLRAEAITPAKGSGFPLRPGKGITALGFSEPVLRQESEQLTVDGLAWSAFTRQFGTVISFGEQALWWLPLAAATSSTAIRVRHKRRLTLSELGP